MISIIIASLNEEEGIRYVVEGIPKTIKKEKVEIILVDGGSVDGTVKNAKAANAKVRVIFEKRKGKGIAMQTGVKESKGDKIVFIDADGEYNPRYIPYMIELLDGCDMVEGYRVSGHHKLKFETVISNFLSKVTSPFYRDFKVKDAVTGLRALRKKDWERLGIGSHNFVIETEIEIRSMVEGFKVIEFPIWQQKRIGGGSKFVKSYKDWIEMYRFIRKNRDVIKNSKRKVITIKEHKY